MCAGLLQIGASGTDTQTPGSYRDHDRRSLGSSESRNLGDTYEEECAAACCRCHEAASEGRATGTDFSTLREST